MNLLKSRQFYPLFWTQFLGAFNDNLFKNAAAIFILFVARGPSTGQEQILVTIATGLFILPFFLFSATAGEVADKFDRAKVTRVVKFVEILIMIFAAIGLFTGQIYFLLFMLFLLGTQATFFGPIKYAILPQHLQEKDLVLGNGYIEASTFLAILLGTIAGGLLITTQYGPAIVSVALIGIAGAGFYSSCLIPKAPAPGARLKISINFVQETAKLIRHSYKDRNIFLCILAISWSWFIGATYLTQVPAFVKNYLGYHESVVTLILVIFSIGIGIGSLLCNRMLKGQVEVTYVPLSAIGMGIFGVDLYFASRGIHTQGALLSFKDFLVAGGNWRIAIDVFLISLFAGLYTVPLYAFIQKYAERAYLARTIAALNIINALFIVVATVFAIVLFKLAFAIPQLFLITSLFNLVVAAYTVRLLPDALFRSIVRTLLIWLYKVEVKGLENFAKAGKRVIIISNHTSFLDGALIAAFLPVKVTFAVNTYVAKKWWFLPLLKLVDAFPVDPTNPLAMKSFIEVIRKDKIGMIFPEGRITVTGSLMKVYEGPGFIADKSHAKLLPIRIEGAQFTPFSYLRGKVKTHWFPKITLTILPARTFNLPADLVGRKRRQLAAAMLYDIMSDMIFISSDLDKPLFKALIEAKETHGGGAIIAEDPQRQPLTYRSFIAKSMTLSKIFQRYLKSAKNVGVLLPNTIAASLTFFGLQSIRRTPALLNFTAGPTQSVQACQTAGIQVVITSRRFIELANLSPVTTALHSAGLSILYLEDLKDKVRVDDKLYGILAHIAPKFLDWLRGKANPHDPAVVLFTSGSEGTPKGVVLSHRNIQANRYQLSSRVDFGPSDIVFNSLPMFHSFGLTAGTLLPILSGIKTFYYPSPLHYRIIPELIYDTNATLLFGTDTFLSGYANFAHPYDLYSIRYAFSGAEKLKEETRRLYSEKYGVRIFEGYGATETAPVISVNTPMHNRPGSVGRMLPGMDFRIEPVEGIETGGRFWVYGPNVMLGYLKADSPGVLQPPEEGWYDTGDIVSIDADGYLTIQGRLKRFAKIGGEMVSLTAVELAIQSLYPGALHAVLSVRDEKKGERLILCTTDQTANVNEIITYFKKMGYSELSIPKQIKIVETLPVLGSGKIDYVTLQNSI